MVQNQKRPAGPSCLAVVGLVLFVAAAAIAGQLVAQAFFPEPIIALIDITGDIEASNILSYHYRFDYIDRHPEVQGLVLLINSEGGESSASEDLYYQVVRLRERMPVVTSITRIGASGAYYVAVGSNYVMTKPGALVGSVGVLGLARSPDELDDEDLTSGPFKSSGNSKTQFTRGMERVKEQFAGVVYAERLIAWDRWHKGDEPFPQTQDDLATGRLWTGASAIEAGMVDGFGSTSDAIDLVASLAGFKRYRIVHLSDSFMMEAGYPVADFDTDPAVPVEDEGQRDEKS